MHQNLLLLRLLIVLIVLPPSASSSFADEPDHFRKFTVSSDEARILALTGVREFRCDYEVMPSPTTFLVNQGPPPNYQSSLCLFAELYDGTKCVKRYRLAVAVDGFHDLKDPEKGIFSFGWNQEKHQLISVIDNHQVYAPWTASLVLKDFSYMDNWFFENSPVEKRHSVTGTPDFDVYPVAGICGERQFKLGGGNFIDVAGYLKACQAAHSQGAIVIYLYKSSMGEEPPLSFDRSP